MNRKYIFSLNNSPITIIKTKTVFFKYRFIKYRSVKHRSVEYRSIKHCCFEQHFYNHYIYNKDKIKTFVIYSNNDNDNILIIFRSISSIFSDFNIEDTFLLKDTLYMFFIKHCHRNCGKTFQYMEIKRK